MKKILAGLVILLIAIAVLKLVVFETPRVVGNDMAPALQPGDVLLAQRFREPRRGDLVLFTHPQSQQPLIRRVIAMPGETFALSEETPVIDGQPATRQAVKEIRLSRRAGGVVTMWLVREEPAHAGATSDKTDGPSYSVLKSPGRKSRDTKAVTLQDSYYLLSDNRNHGADSRDFGPVAVGAIRAVVTHCITTGPGTVSPQPTKRGTFARLAP